MAQVILELHEHEALMSTIKDTEETIDKLKKETATIVIRNDISAYFAARYEEEFTITTYNLAKDIAIEEAYKEVKRKDVALDDYRKSAEKLRSENKRLTEELEHIKQQNPKEKKRWWL
tara:strand:- start:71148 stop:71501 length:354 start_codon:yes stop_codon:yes gene_type:complete